jgi:hypothetical protein
MIGPSACHKRVFGQAQMNSVFTGFEYVGAFASRDRKLVHDLNARQSLPLQLQLGFTYVFHLVQDCEFEALACRILPQRLRAVGAEVVNAPSSGLDMATPNLGNPFWAIRFKFAGTTYAIHNRYDRKRADQFAVAGLLRRDGPDPRIDDYFLTLI